MSLSMDRSIQQPDTATPAAGARCRRCDPRRQGRHWLLSLQRAVTLAAVATPALGAAQSLPRGLGCHTRCWARAALFGDVLATADPELENTHLAAHFDLESNTAFLIDSTASLMVSANLHGTMSAYKAEWRGPAVDCHTAYSSVVIPDHLRVISHLGIAPGTGSIRGQIAVAVGPTYPDPQSPHPVHLRAHQDAFRCGSQEHPAVDREWTHPNGVLDYSWPFYGPLDHIDYPWFLAPGLTLRPGQPATLRTLTFQMRRAQYHYRYVATVHLYIAPCPDQNLAHNCALPELPDLP